MYQKRAVMKNNKIKYFGYIKSHNNILKTKLEVKKLKGNGSE